MYFFTADEHYGHKNIIKYCDRPFDDINHMNQVLIDSHNSMVSEKDTIYHIGDFCFGSYNDAKNIIDKLNGTHIFITGSHDKWMVDYRCPNKTHHVKDTFPHIIERRFNSQYIVMCHYAMRVWPRSHYNSWQLFGHSHGNLTGIGKQMDVGVDTNGFYPYSLNEIKDIMDTKCDNFNLVKGK